jgi:hypothetical protein
VGPPGCIVLKGVATGGVDDPGGRYSPWSDFNVAVHSSLRERILAVDEDVAGLRFRNSRCGFSAITAAWDVAVTEYYDTLQSEQPGARRPSWSFEILGWQNWYEGRNRVGLGVVGREIRANIGDRDGLSFGGGGPAARERRRSSE